ncbi:multidrug efflux SMR transporter [Mycobacterium sp. pUA109]|uniref:multidrug efflux SMR transporter n=1 Tax=Mycobacterium sp. pUA109 TaxID=3238982 RepID=UPI00351B65B9
MAWLLLIAAIAFEVTATLSLRASDGFAKWGWTIPVAVGYLASFVLLAMVLKRGIPVGVAYGVWSAIGVVATAVLARYLFGDPFTWPMAGGVVLIGAGVFLLEFGSSGHASTS